MFFGEILKNLRREKGWTLKKVSEMTDFTKGYLSQLENNRIKSVPFKTLEILADVFNVAPQFLFADKPYNNVSNFARLQNKAPVLRWNQVENWLIHGDRMENAIALEYVPVVATSKESCFLLKIENDTMECQGRETFNQGEYVIVEPANDADNGEYVICTLSHGSDPILRKITKEGGRIILMPLNHRYDKHEIIDFENFNILGIVIEVRRLIHKN